MPTECNHTKLKSGNNRDRIQKKKKALKSYQNLSEKSKHKKRQYAREWYINLSEEEINEEGQYCRKPYKNLFEDEKQKLFRKNYYITSPKNYWRISQSDFYFWL